MKPAWFSKFMGILIAFIAWSFVCYLMWWAVMKSLELY